MKSCDLKVTIITAVLNRKETVEKALESIFNQSYLNIQLIVVDGNSMDGTMKVLDAHRAKIDLLISESDYGIYHALNKGIGKATGDVVGFLHADDILQNHQVIEKIAKVFEDPSIDAVYGDLVYVKHDNLGHVIRNWRSNNYDEVAFKRGWMPPHPTFYVRRAIYERLGVFDTRYRISADYDTMLRFLAVAKIRTVYIPEVLVRMRVGGISNRSFKSILLKSLEDFDVLRRNRVGGVWTLLNKNIRKVNQFWLP